MKCALALKDYRIPREYTGVHGWGVVTGAIWWYVARFEIGITPHYEAGASKTWVTLTVARYQTASPDCGDVGYLFSFKYGKPYVLLPAYIQTLATNAGHVRRPAHHEKRLTGCLWPTLSTHNSPSISLMYNRPINKIVPYICKQTKTLSHRF